MRIEKIDAASVYVDRNRNLVVKYMYISMDGSQKVVKEIINKQR